MNYDDLYISINNIVQAVDSRISLTDSKLSTNAIKKAINSHKTKDIKAALQEAKAISKASLSDSSDKLVQELNKLLVLAAKDEAYNNSSQGQLAATITKDLDTIEAMNSLVEDSQKIDISAIREALKTENIDDIDAAINEASNMNNYAYSDRLIENLNSYKESIVNKDNETEEAKQKEEERRNNLDKSLEERLNNIDISVKNGENLFNTDKARKALETHNPKDIVAAINEIESKTDNFTIKYAYDLLMDELEEYAGVRDLEQYKTMVQEEKEKADRLKASKAEVKERRKKLNEALNEQLNRLNVYDENFNNIADIKPAKRFLRDHKIEDLVEAIKIAEPIKDRISPIYDILYDMSKEYTGIDYKNMVTLSTDNQQSINPNPQPEPDQQNNQTVSGPQQNPQPQNTNSNNNVPNVNQNRPLANAKQEHKEPVGIYKDIIDPSAVQNKNQYYVDAIKELHEVFKTMSIDDKQKFSNDIGNIRNIAKQMSDDALLSSGTPEEVAAAVKVANDINDKINEVCDVLKAVRDAFDGYISVGRFDLLIDRAINSGMYPKEFIEELKKARDCKVVIENQEHKKTVDNIMAKSGGEGSTPEYNNALSAMRNLFTTFSSENFSSALAMISLVSNEYERRHLEDIYDTAKFIKDEYRKMNEKSGYVGQITPTAIEQLIEHLRDTIPEDQLDGILDRINEIKGCTETIRNEGKERIQKEIKEADRIFTDESRIDSKHSYMNASNAKNTGYLNSNSVVNKPSIDTIKRFKEASAGLKDKASAKRNDLIASRYLINHASDYGITKEEMKQLIKEDNEAKKEAKHSSKQNSEPLRDRIANSISKRIAKHDDRIDAIRNDQRSIADALVMDMERGVRDGNGNIIDYTNKYDDSMSRKRAYTTIGLIATISTLAAIQLLVLAILYRF